MNKEISDLISKNNAESSIRYKAQSKFLSFLAEQAGNHVKNMLLSTETKDIEFNRGCWQTYQDVVHMYRYIEKEMLKEMEELKK